MGRGVRTGTVCTRRPGAHADRSDGEEDEANSRTRKRIGTCRRAAASAREKYFSTMKWECSARPWRPTLLRGVDAIWPSKLSHSHGRRCGGASELALSAFLHPGRLS